MLAIFRGVQERYVQKGIEQSRQEADEEQMLILQKADRVFGENNPLERSPY